MTGEHSVRVSARCLWACSCGETKIDMCGARAVFVLLFLLLSVSRRKRDWAPFLRIRWRCTMITFLLKMLAT